MKENNFSMPVSIGFSREYITDKDLSIFEFPVIVKPVELDSAKPDNLPVDEENVN